MHLSHILGPAHNCSFPKHCSVEQRLNVTLLEKRLELAWEKSGSFEGETQDKVWEGEDLAQQRSVSVTSCKVFAPRVLTFVKQFFSVCLSLHLAVQIASSSDQLLARCMEKSQPAVKAHCLTEGDHHRSESKWDYDFLLCEQNHKTTSWFGSTHLVPVHQTPFGPSAPWTFLLVVIVHPDGCPSTLHWGT